ncbi:hypothetical protein CFC21_106043 [Triticum aestivum]|uniref:Pierisin-like domain-containing protein n=2 Tax=Triticum aestivum TaxID=4565 RepID=A0A3B5XZM7_WHEAT|nr:uncharacterized protein LOC123129169 [Triticum aestivum]KAF7105212.1 hypothetical protein CFC21_106043 [Triticum aestivum]
MTSIPPGSALRDCAAGYPQPIDHESATAALRLRETVGEHNGDVVYRGSGVEQDITRHVFRWNTTDYRQVFENGFQARPQGDTPDGTYFNLDHHVHHGGAPGDPDRPEPHAFISTTVNTRWVPDPPTTILPVGGRMEIYRYEIYAPGGIWVNETLLERYRFPAQAEVAFVGGIAPQYIHSAQLFILTRPRRFPERARADQRIILNGHFSPDPDPDRRLIIQNPVHYYVDDETSKRRALTIKIWRPQLPNATRKKRDTSDNIVDWYAKGVEDSPGYINAAFRSSRSNEVYLFMQNEYVLVNYAPGTTDDSIVNGPLLICDGYPSLHGTAFGEHGIDCAFDSHDGSEAIIFCSNLCAHIDYAPGTTNDRILNGPMTITAMFPFFNGTEFADSIDAAFTSSVMHEAYLFKGDSYANINYSSKTCIAIRKITEGFYSLRNTIFESGVEAAFASHLTDEAYIFKGDQYALINVAHGTTDDYIIGGVKPIAPNWPCLRRILPRKNLGVDDHGHHNQEQADQDHVHDEL